MTDKTSLTPLYGLGPYEPLSYLLEFGGCRILLDCGWDSRFNDSDISGLKLIGNVDCVLISHSTLQHLGALPYAVAKLGLSCPVYATLPTLKMGLMTMYDAFQNATSNNKQFTHFSIDDVDFAANLFVPLKFCQPFRLTGNGEGIQISAINAGNVLGGTIWRISRESDEVVYAVDFNHKIERHLDRSHIETIFRPSLLITDCFNFDLQHQPRSKRDAELIKSVMGCLVGGGDVLLPVDAAGRSLELLLLLHSHWKINALVGRFSLVFLAHTARHSIDFANSMLEWTNGRCQKEFDASKRSPFDFENLRICTKLADLEHIPCPRVILASNQFLENGFSHQIFLKIAQNRKNLLLLTQRSPQNTIAGVLQRNPMAKNVDFKITETEYLTGEELEEHLQFARETEREIKRMEKSRTEGNDIEIIDEDIVFSKKYGKKRGIKKRKIAQIYPMFPFPEKYFVSDDYGEKVDFLDLLGDSNEDSVDDDVISVEFSNKSKKFIKRDERNRIIEKDKDSKKEQKTEKMEDIPVKTVTKMMQVDVNCKVQFIDFEGRSDGPSVFNILHDMAPRKLILIHGSRQNAAKMKNKLSKFCGSISAPKISHKIDVSTHSTFFKVVLNDNFTKNLIFSKSINGYKVVPINGVISGKSSLSNLPILNNLNDEKSAKFNVASAFLGNPKLAELKTLLLEKGIKADLKKGEVLCGLEGSKSSIKKLTAKDFYISGNISEDYFNARKALYGMFDMI